jgi:hypothetical protein
MTVPGGTAGEDFPASCTSVCGHAYRCGYLLDYHALEACMLSARSS